MSRLPILPWLTLVIAGLGSLPLSAKDGDDLLNRPPADWGEKTWIQTGTPLTLASLKGKVVLVRFWTDQCAWCRSTAPGPPTDPDLLNSRLRDAVAAWVSRDLRDGEDHPGLAYTHD